ncbi:MAG: carotenoid 1,2-hydratase [Gammaproteobacteria bacterium]|nr:carotenoid 1,2-hydratase [Gammaproteobacteria bacterium]
MTERARAGTRWFLAAVAVVTIGLLGHGRAPPDRRPGSDDPTRYLRGGAAGFARALAPRVFSFPADHGAHGDFRSEWWYFTGHLAGNSRPCVAETGGDRAAPEATTAPASDSTTLRCRHGDAGRGTRHPAQRRPGTCVQCDPAAAAGRHFGFQLTLFRFELAPTAAASSSAWRTPRIMLGHFALSDLDRARFHHEERLARAHPALAGIRSAPLEIYLDDWSIRRLPGPTERWSLRARGDDAAIDLELTATSAIVLQGDAGLSRKGATPGNASYYYSIPRLAAHGAVEVDGASQAVAGRAWLDREWSTSALERSQRGWDWFALQLDDGANLMFYRLRDATGAGAPYSAGSLQHADGRVEHLAAADVTLSVTAWWRSPASGARYPARWRLAVADAGLDLDIRPALADQEWRGRLRYWEGAVTVSGSRAGRGYVELTGY